LRTHFPLAIDRPICCSGERVDRKTINEAWRDLGHIHNGLRADRSGRNLIGPRDG
jgi:hypothetical protein